MIFTLLSLNISYKPQVAYFNAQYFRDTLEGFEKVNDEEELLDYYVNNVGNLFYEKEAVLDRFATVNEISNISGLCSGSNITRENGLKNDECTLQNHINTQQLVGKACFIQYRAALDTCARPSLTEDLQCYPIKMNFDEYELGDIYAGGKPAEW